MNQNFNRNVVLELPSYWLQGRSRQVPSAKFSSGQQVSPGNESVFVAWSDQLLYNITRVHCIIS